MSRPTHIRFLSQTARFYDSVVRTLGFSRLWEEVAEGAKPAQGVRCLDVCTGTGGVALALAKRGASVVGIDLAPGMLQHAVRKTRNVRLQVTPSWLQMDARRLAFPTSSYPVVTCAMALHEMEDEERSQVLTELNRVSSDRVLVAEYRVPEPGPKRLLFQTLRSFEYLESDDFRSFVKADFRTRLEAANLTVMEPWDAGSYRVWSCRVSS